ncbi:MAG: hypothetical protein AB7U95_27970 [Reyranella sp.]
MSNEMPEWAKDVVYTDTDFHFDFRDRVKILFGWRLWYHSGVATEERAGRTQHFTDRTLLRNPKWWPFKPKPMTYVAVSDEVGI